MRYSSLFNKISPNKLVYLLIIITGFAIYANTFPNKMFWDDEDNILKNQYVQDWQYFPKYFSENLIAGSGLLSNYWRPMLLSLYSLEWHLWGNWPPGYHFVNTSLHIANAALLFFILLYLFKSRPLAVFSALLFLVHPLQTEAIAPTTGTGDPLSAFFIFIGIIFWLKFRAGSKEYFYSKAYFISLLMYVFALMSKEIAIVMPAFIFIVDFFLEEKEKPLNLKEKLKKICKAIWPFLLLGLIYILLRATVLNFINTFNFYNEANVFTENFYIRFFTFLKILTVYFRLLFWPFGLHMERSVEAATSLFSPTVILGGLIFFGLLGLAFICLKRFPVLSFGIFWFFIGLAPTSNLAVSINGMLYEHWLYLPMIGVFLIVTRPMILISEKYKLSGVLLAAFIIYLIFFAVLTINRNKDWGDPITFYTKILEYAPKSYRVLNNLGMAYADKNDYNRAETAYRKAIAVFPSSPVAYHNLGNAYRATGKTDLAIENYRIAIKFDPGFFFSYNALADTYLKNENYKDARRVLEVYLNNSPSKINILFLLAQIATREKDLGGALDYLNKASLIDPQNKLIENYIINLNSLIESQKLKIENLR